MSGISDKKMEGKRFIPCNWDRPQD